MGAATDTAGTAKQGVLQRLELSKRVRPETFLRTPEALRVPAGRIAPREPLLAWEPASQVPTSAMLAGQWASYQFRNARFVAGKVTIRRPAIASVHRLREISESESKVSVCSWIGQSREALPAHQINLEILSNSTDGPYLVLKAVLALSIC